MGSYRVKVLKVISCEDPSRGSSWQVRLHPPVDWEQFEIIDRIIRSLRNILDSYLIVDLAVPLQGLEYIQLCRGNENLWKIELHFDRPYTFTYERGGKAYVRRHPWTQMAVYMRNVDEVVGVFQEILCHLQLPDLTRWRNCTREIYLERFERQNP